MNNVFKTSCNELNYEFQKNLTVKQYKPVWVSENQLTQSWGHPDPAKMGIMRIGMSSCVCRKMIICTLLSVQCTFLCLASSQMSDLNHIWARQGHCLSPRSKIKQRLTRCVLIGPPEFIPACIRISGFSVAVLHSPIMFIKFILLVGLTLRCSVLFCFVLFCYIFTMNRLDNQKRVQRKLLWQSVMTFLWMLTLGSAPSCSSLMYWSASLDIATHRNFVRIL